MVVKAVIATVARAVITTVEVVVKVVEGDRQVRLAWRARGGGYANEVSSQGWKDFMKCSAEARAAYAEAWKLRPDWPLAPAQMVYVAMGEGELGDMRLWFDRATAAQIDEPRQHRTRRRWPMQVR